VPLTGLTGVAQSRPNCSELSRINSISIQSFSRVLYTLVILFVTQDCSYGTGKERGKEKKRRGAFSPRSYPSEFGEGAAPSMSAARG
jgi:hypothetical protein